MTERTAGQQLRAAREGLGFQTQEEAAAQIGATKSMWSAWESDAGSPSVHRANELAARFGVPTGVWSTPAQRARVAAKAAIVAASAQSVEEHPLPGRR